MIFANSVIRFPKPIRVMHQRLFLINTSDVLDGKCLNHEYVPNKKLKGQFKKTFRKGTKDFVLWILSLKII